MTNVVELLDLYSSVNTEVILAAEKNKPHLFRAVTQTLQQIKATLQKLKIESDSLDIAHLQEQYPFARNVFLQGQVSNEISVWEFF
jgi:hypothetical protein